jgi:anaerobic magnesium-protoporphyrin IX monomethyl ester cyclase
VSNLSILPRNEVLVIVPPNSDLVIEGRPLTVTRPEEHSDWSDFMSLGALGLVSALRPNLNIRPLYIDGTVVSFDKILSYITHNRARILAVCAGVLTANYEAALLIFRHAKQADPSIRTVVGNDHFTALPRECLLRADCIDFGFFGNEVVRSFASLIRDLYLRRPIAPDAYPSLVSRKDGSVVITPPKPEPIFTIHDYELIDSVFNHRSIYTDGFQQRVAPRIKELTGRTLKAGVTVDIGRGCIKFATNSACSFCSIQSGTIWKNETSAKGAWQTIEHAWQSGYDYLYITADELPLTFRSLLSEMNDNKPAWWRSIAVDERPIMVGYARADGIADPRKTRLLVELGIRQVMIGMDAGSPISLAAMNKPLQTLQKFRDDYLRHAERLFNQNFQAIRVARDEGMLIRAGFVLGHIGMTSDLLKENVEKIIQLINAGRDTITAVDIEVLSPTPGSTDFTYLTSPEEARTAAEKLGLGVGSTSDLQRAAARWRGQDIVPPELAMRDFTTALMPGVQFSELVEARATVRAKAKGCGIVIGE